MRSFPRHARIALLALAFAGLSAAVAQPPAKPEKGDKPDAKKALVSSKLKITLPEDDAELFIEDKPTVAKGKGKVRTFETKVELEPGKPYEYKFTAKWRPNNYTVITRDRNVEFNGGDEVVADLSQPSPTDKAVIRFVPTPPDIIAKMIALAKVTKDDVVYEPGCGDADITIAAVKAGAKKGVGIDIDPERVKVSKANVKAAKLDDKVDIRLGDALDIKDFGDATVVFLYMGDEFDALIRPNLWKQLKVGTRVVSHRFTMGDWKPDTTQKITGEDGDEYLIHLWTITQEVKDKAMKDAPKAKGEEKKPDGEKKPGDK